MARERGIGHARAFEAALAGFGADVAARHPVLELPSNEAIRSAVESGGGLAIMSRLVVDASIKAGSLIASPLTLPTVNSSCCVTRSAKSQASRAFVRMAQNFDLMAAGSAAAAP